MGRYFTLTLASAAGSKTKTDNLSPKNSPRYLQRPNFAFLLAALATLLAAGYLVQANSLSLKGYEIGRLELEVRELKEQQQRLELEASGLQSIQSIEADVKNLNLIPSGTIRHITGRGYAFNE